jgi:hypothetical protein
MAKDNRQILSGIRIGNKVYTQNGVLDGGNLTEDDPFDELTKSLSHAQIERLTAKKAISGFVKEKKAENKEVTK